MSLQYTRPEFVLCPRCAAKPGAPNLCAECLERRELWDFVAQIRSRWAGSAILKAQAKICPHCNGTPNPECPEHGR